MNPIKGVFSPEKKKKKKKKQLNIKLGESKLNIRSNIKLQDTTPSQNTDDGVCDFFGLPKQEERIIESPKSNRLLFDLNNLSASTINSFITDRMGFFNSKVLKNPFKPVLGMIRGTALEHGLNAYIESQGTISVDDAIDAGMEKLEAELKANNFSDTDKAEEFRECLPGGIRCAVEHFGKYSEIPRTQEKIEFNLKGVELPIVGYLDYTFSNVVRDLKGYAKSPYGLPQGYQIQGSLYRKATGKKVEFVFVVFNKTPKIEVIPLSDAEYVVGLKYATLAAQQIEKLMGEEDPYEVLKLAMEFPNLDSIWDKEQKAEVMRQWRIC